jgi:hypothetical protein
VVTKAAAIKEHSMQTTEAVQLVPVTDKRIVAIAAKNGCTELLTDGPGRYFVGASLIVKADAHSYRVYSSLSDAYAPATLGSAISVAVRLNAEEAEMVALVQGKTDYELTEMMDSAAVSYELRQRVIAERLDRHAKA